MTGVKHWLAQRYTALVSTAGVIWLGWALNHAVAHKLSLQQVLAQPFSGMMFAISSIAMIYHGNMGMEIVMHDYITCERTRLSLTIMFRCASFVVCLMSVFAAFKAML